MASTSAPVTITNMFSSFDTTAVLTQLRAAREQALTKLDTKSMQAQAKKSALQTVSNQFVSLQTALQLLTGTSSVTGKTASTTATNVSATATPTAPVGSFSVDVTQIATGTKMSGAVLSGAPNLSVPIASAGFAISPANGSYTIGTEAGGSKQLTIGSVAANGAAPLNASNFATAVTAGTFTLATSAGSQIITVNPAAQSLNDIVAAINGGSTGITATITNDANGRANKLTLTSSNGPITVGAIDDTSNFLSAVNLSGVTAADTVTSGAAFTQQMSLNDVIADINGAGLGITASITNDANGRPTIVSLTAASNVTLGNSSDTSNFLKAANLLASPGGTTRASTAPVSRVNLGDKLSSAALLGGNPAAGAHTLTINGTSISYDASVDSLSDVLARISASNAGVTASYDAGADKVTFQQTKTGAMAITLADDVSGGNLLAKLGLTGASQTQGTSAAYSINGGATAYATDNNVDLGNGITLNLASTTTPGSPVTVTVGQNSASAVSQVRSFVSAFNGVMSTIASVTKADGSNTNNSSGALSGDVSLRMVAENLRSAVAGPALNPKGNFKNLSDIGLSFGAIGSKVGTTNTLQLDETKLRNALASDPNSVQAVISAFSLTASLSPSGSNSISGMSGTYTGGTPGTYTLTDDGAGNLKSVFVPSSGGPATTQNIVITPNSTNSSLIPGLTLSFGGTLTAGTRQVYVSASSKGVLQSLKQAVDVQVGAGGVLQSRQNTYDAAIADIAKQRDRMQAQIDAEMTNWQKKFSAMEQANAKLQRVQNAVTNMVNQLTSASSSKSG